MITLKSKKILISVDDLGCQVSFLDSKENDALDDHYILLQYMADEEIEDEIKGKYCYIESNDESITGFYKKINAKLFREVLFIDLKKNRMIEIQFKVSERKFKYLKSVFEVLFSGLGKFECI